MAEKYEVRTQAEIFIHNDLSNCAFSFLETAREKYECGNTDGVYHDLMGALVFSAFAVEAKINFVGWKVFQDGWNERLPIEAKVNKLNQEFELGLGWDERPLQTIKQLKSFRNTLAHGKPEAINETNVVEVMPDVRSALEGQWEQRVSLDFVIQCRDDIDELWRKLLCAAHIEINDTITSGGISLKKLWGKNS